MLVWAFVTPVIFSDTGTEFRSHNLPERKKEAGGE